MSKLLLSLLFIVVNFGGSVGSKIIQNGTNKTGTIPEPEKIQATRRIASEIRQIEPESPHLRLIDLIFPTISSNKSIDNLKNLDSPQTSNGAKVK